MDARLHPETKAGQLSLHKENRIALVLLAGALRYSKNKTLPLNASASDLRSSKSMWCLSRVAQIRFELPFHETRLKWQVLRSG